MDYVKGNTVIERQKNFAGARHFVAYARRSGARPKVKESAANRKKEGKANDGV